MDAHNHESIVKEIDELINSYPKLQVLFRMGEKGSSMYSLDENKKLKEIHKPANQFSDHPNLSLVDTTGAGDGFTGGFATKLVTGSSIEEALEFGNRVGFMCITKFGAGPSIPWLEDVEKEFKL